MSFCRLCGAGFEFVGEHKPGCEAVTPKPPAAPALPEGHAMRDRLVDAFNCADGYWFSRHDVDAILRALATQGLHIVDAKDRAVLEACSAFPTEALKGELYPDWKQMSDISLRWSEAELARRGEP